MNLPALDQTKNCALTQTRNRRCFRDGDHADLCVTIPAPACDRPVRLSDYQEAFRFYGDRRFFLHARTD